MKTSTLYTETATLLCGGDVASIKIRKLSGLKACGIDRVIVKVVGVKKKKRAALKGRGK